MKVNSGTARGRPLRSVPGDTTRPITDIVKQALFNILMDEAPGTRWLDLFGGTGAVGIEALSRGAASCVFLDTAPAAIRTIEENLRNTGLADKAKVIRQDALRHIAGRPNVQYDFIYIAPHSKKGCGAALWPSWTRIQAGWRPVAPSSHKLRPRNLSPSICAV
ncbi:MAG: RsmD family RNA methyltransferase [Chloroflexi bacterium]|nr:RsmD family RNA methyltransferase [Chloroflexota bacterium]